MSGITLLGLGPGAPGQITREAWEVLASASDIWLRTRNHLALVDVPPSVRLHSFDDVFENTESLEAANSVVVATVLELGRQSQGVIYAVLGHPYFGEATCLEVLERAMHERLSVRVVDGLSFIEPTLSALGLNPVSGLAFWDALSVSRAHVPPFPPDSPVLITRLHSKQLASGVKAVLKAIYPGSHPISLVHDQETAHPHVENLTLEEIDLSEQIDALSCLYLGPLEKGTSVEALQEVVAHLRAPEGCPWDREQTHASLRRHLLEETYEAIAAMDTDEAAAMREEFGDLLLQIMLNAQIAAELGEFTLNDVAKGIHDKIIERHPHVFGDLKLQSIDSVLSNWERLKERERDNKLEGGGLLDGVPLALPALSQAQEYQERAARVGFDWPEVQGVLEKVAEEIDEVRSAADHEDLAAELGDLLFALVNFCRWKDIDAESALRGANNQFKNRFGTIEAGARSRGQRLSDLTLDEMEELWRQAKAGGN